MGALNAMLALVSLALTALVGWAVSTAGRGVTYAVWVLFWILLLALSGILAVRSTRRSAHRDAMRVRIGDREYWEKAVK